mgnify:CR=1 FL=1
MAVIAVLAAMLLPVLSRARLTAKETACVNNHRQAVISLFMYADDGDEYFPIRKGDGGNWGYHPSSWNDQYSIINGISPLAWDMHETAELYLSAPHILACPVRGKDPEQSWPLANGGIWDGWYTGAKAFYAGYAWENNKYNDNDTDPGWLAPRKLGELADPTRVALASDAVQVPWWATPEVMRHRHLEGIDEDYLLTLVPDPNGFELEYDAPVGVGDGSVRKEASVRIFYQVGGTASEGFYVPDLR